MTIFCRPHASRWCALAFAFFASIPHAHAETSESLVELVVWQGRFDGRIGDKAVQVSYLHRIGDRIEGAYCDGICDPPTGELRLSGTWRDDVLLLDESAPDASGKPQTTGHWRLQPDGKDWQGEWRSPDGRRQLPATLMARDDAVAPYELRVMAAFVPGTDEDNCDLQSPPVTAIRVYRDGALLQTLDTDSMGTCGMFLPEQVDMDFDGNLDLTIALTLPAGPNIPHQSWLFDPDAGRFVDAPASLQDISSPEFDPAHRLVYHFWRGSCCSHGVDTYRWKDGDLVALDSQESHLVPVLRQGKVSYLYSVPGYVDGEIVYSPRIVRDHNGKLDLEGFDATTFELNDEPFAWGESLAVDVFKIDRKGASRRERSDTMRWRRIDDATGLRWCADLAAYDIDQRRIMRRLIDTPESCTDKDPR
jgi:hypothetical protein